MPGPARAADRRSGGSAGRERGRAARAHIGRSRATARGDPGERATVSRVSVAVWVLLCLASAGAGFALGRGRARRRGRPAALLALHFASLAMPALRAGLTEETAHRAVRHLRALLGRAALVITSRDRVLAREGAGAPDDAAVLRAVGPTLAEARTRVIPGEPGAVTVPLTTGGRVVGALAVYRSGIGERFARAAAEVGAWVSGQLELGELDTARRRVEEAEMRALQAQISPHFVYNSLTTIASFVRTDPERARELLLEFAEFVRYALRRKADLTTLADELICMDRYLVLERARFGDRLRFTVQVAPEVLGVRVPFLCLQPLVENAIKHGMPGEVRAVIKDAGSEAHIWVEDDGIGMDPDQVKAVLSEEPTTGIGLSNVDRRMRSIFGPEYGLIVETAPNQGTKVHLRIPKNRARIAGYDGCVTRQVGIPGRIP